jgi:Glycosyl transferase family 2
MAPRFSVLLPTHNRADLLGLAIKSVLWQTEPDFELLIVGDGCTDNSAEVVAGFNDPRIRWFDLPKAPYFGYANRNVALREARGDLIAFMAHDDLLFPDHLSVLADSFRHETVEWAYSRPLWVSTDGMVLPFAVNLTHPDELHHFLTVANSIPAACVMHRRSCFETYGYWPEDIPSAADWRFWIRIIEGGRCERFAYCSKPTCLHFKASWRKGRAGYPPADALSMFVDRLGWWPTALKLDIPAGVLEQQVFFAAMAAGGACWVEALRTGADEALDRLALAATSDLIPRSLAQEAELQRSTARLQQLETELAQRTGLEGKLQQLESELAEMSELRAAVQRLKREIDADEACNRRQGEELGAVYASRSWRLTAPLRGLKTAIAKWRSR